MKEVTQNFDKMLGNNGPMKFTDYVSNKFNIIHEQLYMEALEEYYKSNSDKYSDCDDFSSFLSEYKIIEIKGKEFNLPSSVIISSKHFPYKQNKVDLSLYWNLYEFNSNNKDISQLISDEDTITDAQLVYINYVTGKCKFRSKFTGREFWTTIDYINSETKVNKEEMTLKGTFGSLIKKRS